jgi:hypothetical protein
MVSASANSQFTPFEKPALRSDITGIALKKASDGIHSGVHMSLGPVIGGIDLPGRNMGWGLSYEIGHQFYLGRESENFRFGLMTNWLQIAVYGQGNGELSDLALMWEWHFLRTGFMASLLLNDETDITAHLSIDPTFAFGVPFDYGEIFYYWSMPSLFVFGAKIRLDKMTAGVDLSMGVVQLENYYQGEIFTYYYSDPIYLDGRRAYFRIRPFFGFKF